MLKRHFTYRIPVSILCVLSFVAPRIVADDGTVQERLQVLERQVELRLLKSAHDGLDKMLRSLDASQSASPVAIRATKLRAEVHLLSHDLAQAMVWVERCEEYLDEHALTEHHLDVALLKGDIHHARGESEPAILLLEQALGRLAARQDDRDGNGAPLSAEESWNQISRDYVLSQMPTPQYHRALRAYVTYLVRSDRPDDALECLKSAEQWWACSDARVSPNDWLGVAYLYHQQLKNPLGELRAMSNLIQESRGREAKLQPDSNESQVMRVLAIAQHHRRIARILADLRRRPGRDFEERNRVFVRLIHHLGKSGVPLPPGLDASNPMLRPLEFAYLQRSELLFNDLARHQASWRMSRRTQTLSGDSDAMQLAVLRGQQSTDVQWLELRDDTEIPEALLSSTRRLHAALVEVRLATDPEIFKAKSVLGSLYVGKGDFLDQARELLDAANEYWTEGVEKGNPSEVTVEFAVGTLHSLASLDSSDLPKAQSLLEKSLEYCELLRHHDDLLTIRTKIKLGQLYWKRVADALPDLENSTRKDRDQARKFLRRLLEATEMQRDSAPAHSEEGENSPARLRVLEGLAMLRSDAWNLRALLRFQDWEHEMQIWTNENQKFLAGRSASYEKRVTEYNQRVHAYRTHDRKSDEQPDLKEKESLRQTFRLMEREQRAMESKVSELRGRWRYELRQILEEAREYCKQARAELYRVQPDEPSADFDEKQELVLLNLKKIEEKYDQIGSPPAVRLGNPTP